MEKIASINPFRYRSYYYDSETGLYYLQSRYYDPAVGRFVNSDQPELLKFIIDMMDCNLYTYCGNDASNNFDVDGNFSLKGIFRTIKDIISISWKGLTIKLSSVAAAILGIATIILKLKYIVKDVKDIYKFLDNSKMATAIVTALPYASSYLSSEVIACICNVGAVVAMMSGILTFFMACCSGVLSVGMIVLQFVKSYILPTVYDAVKMLYYSVKKNKGCKYYLKWIGGVSIIF